MFDGFYDGDLLQKVPFFVVESDGTTPHIILIAKTRPWAPRDRTWTLIR